MLIATSGWLLYQTSNDYLGGVDRLLSHRLAAYLDEPKFLFPALGGVLGLLGGLTVFFAGPGGALIALAGGVAVAGFAVQFEETLELSRFWDNELTVGVVMLMLAAMTGSMARR